jgi:type IV pilus biogenesis protein PilP
MLLEAQAKRAAAKAEMLKNQADAGEDSAFVGQPSASVVASELPTVTGISTTGGRLYATFRYPNGTTSRAAAGESIPGGYQVTEISLERAVVTRGDRRIPLQTGVAAPAASENARGAFPGQMVPPPTANMLQRR